MPPIVRLGDTGSGHGSFPPTNVCNNSDDSNANSLGICRQGDCLGSHGSPSPSPPHSRAACGGSSDTFVNSRPVIRIGDPVCCGGMLVTGSPDIIVN